MRMIITGHFVLSLLLTKWLVDLLSVPPPQRSWMAFRWLAPGAQIPKDFNATKDASSSAEVLAQDDSAFSPLNSQGASFGNTSKENQEASLGSPHFPRVQPPRTILPGSHFASVLKTSPSSSSSCVHGILELAANEDAHQDQKFGHLHRR